MDRKISNMSNRQLCQIAKAFDNCGNCKSCKNCPCDGVLCNHDAISEARYYFICEIGKRITKMIDAN